MAIWRKPLVYQRNACKSITDDRGRAGSGENDLCQKIKPFAEHDLRVTLQRAGNEYVTIAVNRNLSNYENGPKKRFSVLQRDSNLWPVR